MNGGQIQACKQEESQVRHGFVPGRERLLATVVPMSVEGPSHLKLFSKHGRHLSLRQ